MIGVSVKRKEDPRLLTGRGKYAGDVRLPGMLHAVVLRSTHAHARLRGIDATGALAIPGVVAVITSLDVGGSHQIPMRRIPVRLGQRATHPAPLQPPLATDRVRYVGEPMALVVAESRYLAEDALEAIMIDYDPLPIVADVYKAIEPGAPVLHDALGGNVVERLRTRSGDV